MVCGSLVPRPSSLSFFLNFSHYKKREEGLGTRVGMWWVASRVSRCRSKICCGILLIKIIAFRHLHCTNTGIMSKLLDIFVPSTKIFFGCC